MLDQRQARGRRRTRRRCRCSDRRKRIEVKVCCAPRKTRLQACVSFRLLLPPQTPSPAFLTSLHFLSLTMLASSAAFLALGALAVRAQSQATELDLEVEQVSQSSAHAPSCTRAPCPSLPSSTLHLLN